jgi:hypothetical protein
LMLLIRASRNSQDDGEQSGTSNEHEHEHEHELARVCLVLGKKRCGCGA